MTVLEEVSEKSVAPPFIQESKPKNDPQVNQAFFGSARGKAPENLPIAVMPVFEGADMSTSDAVNNIAQENEELLDADVMVLDEPVMEAKGAVNPEPSIEELKERLNKLLRGKAIKN